MVRASSMSSRPRCLPNPDHLAVSSICFGPVPVYMLHCLVPFLVEPRHLFFVTFTFVRELEWLMELSGGIYSINSSVIWRGIFPPSNSC